MILNEGYLTARPLVKKGFIINPFNQAQTVDMEIVDGNGIIENGAVVIYTGESHPLFIDGLYLILERNCLAQYNIISEQVKITPLALKS